MKKQKTQWQDVLFYLQTHQGISSFEAWEMFHITRLAAVIFILRKRGHNIVSIDKTGCNEYGPYTYTEYRLEENLECPVRFLS